MTSPVYGSEYGADIAGNSNNLSTVSAPDLRYLINAETGDDNAPVGNTSNNYVAPGSYTGTGLTNTANFPDLSSLGGIAKALLTDKNGNLNLQVLGALGGGVLGAMGAGKSTSTPTGYQGGIPLLSATRNMITAPPTKAQGYRPGAGGINYGGDVTYSRLSKGTDPWVNLSGNSGTAAGANLTPITAPATAVTPGVTSPVSTVATPPKSTDISSQQINDKN